MGDHHIAGMKKKTKVFQWTKGGGSSIHGSCLGGGGGGDMCYIIPSEKVSKP